MALLLFLFALASLLLWLPLPQPTHAGNTGQIGSGAGVSVSGDGTGNATRGSETGQTDHGNQHASAESGKDTANNPNETGVTRTPQALAIQANTHAQADTQAKPTLSQGSEQPAEPNTTTPETMPELGFASDLSALPTENDVATTEPAPSTLSATAFSDTMGNGQGAAGQAGMASFFGATGQGTRFVFVLDKSGSMNGKAFADARFELIRSLRALQPHEKFYVIFYDNDAEPMPAPGLVPATQGNIDRYVKWVREVSTGGGTDPTAAMTKALKDLKPDTIWLLSDGAFNVAVAETITQLNPQRRVHINTIAFKNRAGEAILKIIADENKGDYRFVGSR